VPVYKLEIAFDGSDFSGWQRQLGKSQTYKQESGLDSNPSPDLSQAHPETGDDPLSVKTIQGCFDQALSTLLGVEPQTFETIASGRTDKGVHARSQVISLSLENPLPGHLDKVRRSLNALTPGSIGVLDIVEAPEDFNARRAPHRKCYAYSFYLGPEVPPSLLGRVHRVGKDLDISEMILAARVLVGEHDFSSFQASDCTAKTTIRTLHSSEIIRVEPHVLQYRVVGKGFLMHMVRIISGTLLDIGLGRTPRADLVKILKACDRSQAGDTLPARGLSLEWLRYGE